MKNIVIKTHGTTITVKDYLLDLYAEKVLGGTYAENKRAINANIRAWISKDAKDSKYVSQEVTRTLTNLVAKLR